MKPLPKIGPKKFGTNKKGAFLIYLCERLRRARLYLNEGATVSEIVEQLPFHRPALVRLARNGRLQGQIRLWQIVGLLVFSSY